MAEDSADSGGNSGNGIGTLDRWIARFVGHVTKQISTVVAALFLLFALGAVYGSLVTARQHELGTWLLIAPAALGLLAYYSRGFALALFVLIVIFFAIL
ncbi:MAG: hypothetical protein ABH854_03920 [Candidatus Diapherotrites archaeon]|nr:hypothetical protein [Candidatus Micrarchaeota archaeon]MBU1939406.1 hypothetical protein [Candidatus Micrarchaeota archaeon]